MESLAFLDPEHPHYSSELAAAVGVWDALFEQGEYRIDQAPKQQIVDWLKRQYPDLSEQMRDHITGVVNPHRKGGAPTRNS